MSDKKQLLKSLRLLNQYGGENNLPENQDCFAQYKPEFPIRVYRGICFNSLDDFYDKFKTDLYPKKGQKFFGFYGIHWTTSLEIAEEFAAYPGSKVRLILMADVDPEQITVEMDRLSADILSKLEWTNEEEVILKHLEIETKVFDIWVADEEES